MQPIGDSALVLFPGALGDFLCFLPTLVALRARHSGRMLFIASPTALQLVRGLDLASASIDRQEVAQLFVAGPLVSPPARQLLGGFDRVYSWMGFGNPDVCRRLAALTGGRVDVHPFRGMQVGEHAADYYARCAAVRPNTSVADFIADDPEWFAPLQRRHHLENGFAVFHPGSGSPAKNWEGFGAVVRWWKQESRRPALLLRGPAEVERGVGSCGGADAVLDGLTLPQVATVCRRAHLYVGNDSGISHLAAAVGATGVALFGPTDPAIWAPRGRRLTTVHAPDACARCGTELFCVHRLTVRRVLAAIAKSIPS